MLQVINPIKNALVQGYKKLPKKRIASFVGMFLFCAMATYASSKGAGGFTKATTEISSYQTPVANLMKAIQDAEWRPGREEDHYDDHWRLRGLHCYVGGTSYVLQVSRTVTNLRRCPLP